jgi:KaiC/GvpD/RAD55 family RecA-like ATPase
LRNMAPRASSKRPAVAARSYGPKVESAEVKRSRRAAILQLRIGRLAHSIGIASSLALALTAILVYGLEDGNFLEGASDVIVELKWSIPLIAGIVVALVTLYVKWEPYVADKEEPHFVMSIAAVVVSAMLIAIIYLQDTDRVHLDISYWFYPASLLGISMTELSLAMTWEGASRRKTIGIAAAVFPIALMSLPLIYRPAEETLLSILPMVYLGCAVSIQLSGSMLHIIASSTSVQQREVLKASDSKLKEQVIELEKKRAAISYREDALRSKESELEVYEKKLSDELVAIEDQKQQIDSLQNEVEQRLEGARETRQNIAMQESQIEKDRESLQIRLSELETQRRELEKLSKSITAREGAVASREKEASKLQLDLQSKERDIRNRIAELQAEDGTAKTTAQELNELQDALAEREKQLEIRESSLEMKSLEAQSAKETMGKVAAEKSTIRSLEQQILAKQEALAAKEIAAKALEDDIRKKAERAERLTTRADQQMNELVDRESKLLAKEKELSDKEAGLRADLQGLTSRLEDMDRVKASISDKERQYQDLSESTRSRLTSISTREEETTRKMSALEKREAKIKELELALKAERDKMNSKLKDLLEKEKDLKAEETELSLRHAELKVMEREILEKVDEVEEYREEIPEEDEREKTLEVREKRLMEKEQEVKSRLYQREKELEKKEHSLKAQLSKDLEDMEEAVEEEYAVEKVKTGIERLDDLLLGGMPFGSNVLCVGPPFIGKEVAMLLFIAEGLKKGIPAVIVTTSHSISEISKDMAPILPTFMEFDQLGLVRWIDASSIGEVEDPLESTHNTVIKVSGPGDFEGITKALEKCVKEFQKQKQPYFRLIYMSLSMSITQVDEKDAFMFVQGFAGRVKTARGVSMFAVERGMHTEQQLEAIQHHMSGSVQFKTDKQKTLMSVQGIGDAQTRAWIEYRHTNKALMIGAFSLERIR